MPLIFNSFNQSTNMISSYHCQALWRNQWRAMQTKQTLTSRNLWSTYKVSSVQSHSHVWLFATPWLQHARPSCPSTNPGVHPNPCPLSRWCHPAISSCHPLLLLPPIFPSIRVFSTESALRIRWPKYWSFSFNISPSNEHPGLISFKTDKKQEKHQISNLNLYLK